MADGASVDGARGAWGRRGGGSEEDQVSEERKKEFQQGPPGTR